MTSPVLGCHPPMSGRLGRLGECIMRCGLVLTFVIGLATSAHGQTQTFFLHHSDTPVSVPGGTTSFFLDELAPTTLLPTVEQQVVAPGDTQSFPTFISVPFAADTTLWPIASVVVNLSANQKMRGCADLNTDLFKVDGGGTTPIGSAAFSGTTIFQGHAGGTTSEASQRIEFAVTDPSILAGQGIALTTTVTNQCSIQRRLFFAYDGLYDEILTPTRVRFQCCFTRAATCGAAKIKVVARSAACLLGLEAKQAGKGVALDPVKAQGCRDKLGKVFGRLEHRGGCITVGDALPITAKIDAFVADVASELAPTGPPNKNSCQGAKIKAASSAAACLLALDAKRAAKGQFLDPDPSKVDQCRSTLLSIFGKRESKGTCATSGDAAAIQDKVGAFVTDLTSTLACPCP